MADTAYVYALLDGNGKPRYVGCSVNPCQRLRDHWSAKHRPDRAKYNPGLYGWLCSLDTRPKYRVIAQVAYADRFKWEKFYTERCEDSGFDLFNLRKGCAGIPASTKARAKMSVSQKARWTAEMRAKTSAERKALYANNPKVRAALAAGRDKRWAVA